MQCGVFHDPCPRSAMVVLRDDGGADSGPLGGPQVENAGELCGVEIWNIVDGRVERILQSEQSLLVWLSLIVRFSDEYHV